MKDLQIRTEYLDFSLRVENSVSKFLSGLVGVDDYKQSLSFGTSSQALSFNAKINLLLDLAHLDKFQKEKFVKFMEIRNKFMHVLDADTYEKCIELISGMENWLFKHYPPKETDSKEEQLHYSAIKLAREIDHLGMGIFISLMEKTIEESRNQSNKKTVNAFMATQMIFAERKADPDLVTATEFLQIFEEQLRLAFEAV